MKRTLTILAVIGLLVLLVGGCGSNDLLLSSASESGSVADNGNETTTTTSYGRTNANCTYPTVPFAVGASVRERDETFTEDFRGKVITSKVQLDALGLDAEYETSSYTDNYFENKALIVLEFRLTSGSIQLRIDNVWASVDTMQVRYTTLCPNPHTNDMAYRRILLEINQKDADGIEHIVGERVPIQLPSGSPSNPTAL